MIFKTENKTYTKQGELNSPFVILTIL